MNIRINVKIKYVTYVFLSLGNLKYEKLCLLLGGEHINVKSLP